MTKIQWTEATWNPVVGCSPVSEGCRNCYAAKHAIRLGANPQTAHAYAGTAEMRGLSSKRRAVFTGKVNTLKYRLEEPLRWREPRRVFVNSMSDLFHEAVPDDFIDRVFAVMALARRHTFQILTKRPERMAEYFHDLKTNKRVATTAGYSTEDSDEVPWRCWPLSNVWLGTSVEDQAAADERIPHLLRTPAAVRFLSCEPLLGPVNLRQDWRDFLEGWDTEAVHVCGGHDETCHRRCPEAEWVQTERIHWVIVGGESGPGARPMDVAWARSLVKQCQAAGVPAFVKQLGARPFDSADRISINGPDSHAITYDLRDPKGGDPAEWPEDLRVREFPEPAPAHA